MKKHTTYINDFVSFKQKVRYFFDLLALVCVVASIDVGLAFDANP
jgi:hypothetical protein